MDCVEDDSSCEQGDVSSVDPSLQRAGMGHKHHQASMVHTALDRSTPLVQTGSEGQDPSLHRTVDHTSDRAVALAVAVGSG